MSGAPRHHVVPEMYLKGFLDPAKVAVGQYVLWVYGENKKVRPKGADRVAADEGFNRTPENPGSEDVAEKAYTFIEWLAEPILEKLRAGDARLKTYEKEQPSYFIGLQKFRRAPGGLRLVLLAGAPGPGEPGVQRAGAAHPTHAGGL